MHPGEIEVMARAEETHWWYLGLRDALGRCLGHPRMAQPPRPRVLDAGCGTGGTLRFLAEVLVPSYLGGFDVSEEAVAIARRRAPGADVYRSDICDPEIRVDALDLVTSLDVIYIPGTERSIPGLKRLVSALKPGGLLVLNLPAYRWLYSEHDVAIHTSERYTAARVAALLSSLDLSVVRLSYRLFALLPAVVAGRIPGMLRARRGDPGARSDLHQTPGRRSNHLLYRILQAENALIARGVRLPWGSSVFAIGRKT